MLADILESLNAAARSHAAASALVFTTLMVATAALAALVLVPYELVRACASSNGENVVGKRGRATEPPGLPARTLNSPATAPPPPALRLIPTTGLSTHRT